MFRIRAIGILILICLTGTFARAQPSMGIWHFRNISGEVDLRGLYRQLESSFNEVTEDQRSTYLMGGVKLNTTSYLWDEDVVLLDLNGAYSPELRDETYITVPDRSEVRTLKKADLMATVMNNRPLTLQAFYNYDQSYFNRELLTNVRSGNQLWGGAMSLNSSVLPIRISYRNQRWNQEEIQTGRVFRMDQQTVQTKVNKSFGSRDRSEFTYSRNNYAYAYAALHETRHLINRIAFNNNLYFDSARRYNLNSRFTWHDQEGTSTFSRLEWMEGLSLQLPHQLRLRADLNIYRLEDPRQIWNQKRILGSTQHKLFQSLSSRIYIDYSGISQQAADLHEESDIRTGAELRYTKNIPTGHLNLGYHYYRHGHATEGVTGYLQVINEEHRLSDGELILLHKPYAETPSVVVKDITGAVIYQLNFDYILVERGVYLEIQRVPGGQIPDDGAILVDYTFRQPGSYSYGANNHYFSASVLLFRRFLELYYRYAIQDYPRVEQGDLLTLNHFRQHVFGVRLDVGFARAGIEGDTYESNIIPYRMWRYYMDMNWNIRSQVLLTLNGNIRDYRMIAGEEDQWYANVSGKVAYRIRPGMKVSLGSGYLNQRGRNIDLDLLTARAEFQSSFNKLLLRVGVEMYRRMYLHSEFAFNGAYIQLTRRF